MGYSSYHAFIGFTCLPGSLLCAISAEQLDWIWRRLESVYISAGSRLGELCTLPRKWQCLQLQHVRSNERQDQTIHRSDLYANRRGKSTVVQGNRCKRTASTRHYRHGRCGSGSVKQQRRRSFQRKGSGDLSNQKVKLHSRARRRNAEDQPRKSAAGYGVRDWKRLLK